MSSRTAIAAVFVLVIVGAGPVSVAAQTPPANAPAPPAASPKDVASAESIIAALYDALSGTATQQRNWNRFQSLFIPGGRVMPAVAAPPGGRRHVRVMTPEEYAKVVDPQFKADSQGFFEREVARVSESFGAIAHVFSTYESRHALGDPKPFARGINSFQLFNDGTRWWIVSVLWDRERPANPIAAKYLPPAGTNR